MRFELVTGESAPFKGDANWASTATNLTRAAEHLESLGHEIVSVQIISSHFGFVFFRDGRDLEVVPCPTCHLFCADCGHYWKDHQAVDAVLECGKCGARPCGGEFTKEPEA